MKQPLLALLLSSTLATSALAAPVTYNVDASHTYPRYEYNHLGFSTQQGRFNKTSGSVTLDRAAKTGSVDISIDAASVDSGSSLFNTHLNGEEFFSTTKFPTVTFKADSVTFDGDKPATVPGTLTLKGISKPVTLTITSFHCMPHPMLKKEACGANATTSFKRSDFGITKHVPYVSDEVKLSIAIEAIAAQ